MIKKRIKTVGPIGVMQWRTQYYEFLKETIENGNKPFLSLLDIYVTTVRDEPTERLSTSVEELCEYIIALEDQLSILSDKQKAEED